MFTVVFYLVVALVLSRNRNRAPWRHRVVLTVTVRMICNKLCKSVLVRLIAPQYFRKRLIRTVMSVTVLTIAIMMYLIRTAVLPERSRNVTTVLVRGTCLTMKNTLDVAVNIRQRLHRGSRSLIVTVPRVLLTVHPSTHKRLVAPTRLLTIDVRTRLLNVRHHAREMRILLHLVNRLRSVRRTITLISARQIIVILPTVVSRTNMRNVARDRMITRHMIRNRHR